MSQSRAICSAVRWLAIRIPCDELSYPRELDSRRGGAADPAALFGSEIIGSYMNANVRIHTPEVHGLIAAASIPVHHRGRAFVLRSMNRNRECNVAMQCIMHSTYGAPAGARARASLL